MDLEGIVRRLINNESELLTKLKYFIKFYKGEDPNIEKFAEAIVKEVKNSLLAKGELFEYPKTGIKAGEAGLGSRGIGDHKIHEALFKLSGRPLETFDDAGIVDDIVVAIDGIHSRLSYFPYLAGFFATKASLRDIMVKGATPLGIFIDIHLSDDSDIGMLFDFEAGVSTVAEAINVPILAGSTLRIGGDLVIGERISGAVGALGKIRKKTFKRKNIEVGDKIIMTEGNGGGTIATTAIYNGFPEVVKSTISIKELIACKLINDNLSEYVIAMTDVTNGGIRLDAVEISKIKNVSIIINEKKFLNMININVIKMLEYLNIDPYGISIDSIIIFTRNNNEDIILSELSRHGIRADVIGEVSENKGFPILLDDGRPLMPRFRESPYTPVKKVIGDYTPFTIEELEHRINNTINYLEKKKSNVLKNLKIGYTEVK
jgi:hydrogenase expression/formation protein